MPELPRRGTDSRVKGRTESRVTGRTDSRVTGRTASRRPSADTAIVRASTEQLALISGVRARPRAVAVGAARLVSLGGLFFSPGQRQHAARSGSTRCAHFTHSRGGGLYRQKHIIMSNGTSGLTKTVLWQVSPAQHQQRRCPSSVTAGNVAELVTPILVTPTFTFEFCRRTYPGEWRGPPYCDYCCQSSDVCALIVVYLLHCIISQ